MYFRILKKDLRRKKTMNIILLLFIALSAMFASSSVNNIIKVMGGLDSYFEKADMSDYFIIAGEKNGGSRLDDILQNEECVEAYRKENGLSLSADDFKKGNKKALDFSNMSIVMPISEAKLNYFDSDNNIIKEVKKGEVIITGSPARTSPIKIGDKFTVTLGKSKLDLKFAGIGKDALLGSDMMANPKLLLNDDDFKTLANDKAAGGYKISLYYIDTSDEKALESTISSADNIMISGNIGLIRTSYVMSTIIACLLLIVSVCLILVSFVVLKFTIGFTISEEFREIGVMKAVGIKNGSIRRLYLVKYLGLSVIGSVIGFFAGIPFGDLLLSSVSQTIMLENEDLIIVNILCCIAVVGIILLFCWGSTSKIKKMSPIDAVRNGQTGERFKKKSIFSLSKSRLRPSVFLAANDVASAKKQFGIITAVFTVCIMLVMILSNTANTLNSDKLLFLFGTTESDVYYPSTSKLMKVMSGEKTLEESENDIEKMLEDNDMPGKVHIESLYSLPIKFGDEQTKILFQQCKKTKTTDYTYDEGSAPKYDNEIALSKLSAQKIGAKIGDTVTLTIDGEDKEFIITALYQTFNNLGENGRLHQDVKIADTSISTAFYYQIDFDDHPDDKEIDRRIEKLRDICDTDKVFNSADFVKDSTGAADAINAAKNLVLVITAAIIIMISVLMERSFISKEKSEIALMKAMGIKNSSIVLTHTLRFLIIAVTACVIAAAVSVPITKLTIDPIMAMMGAVNGVEYEIDPIETFVIYPVIGMAATVLGAFFTALYTKSIKASDTANIE